MTRNSQNTFMLVTLEYTNDIILPVPGRRPHSICDPIVSDKAEHDVDSLAEHLQHLRAVEETCLAGDPEPNQNNNVYVQKSRLFLNLSDILGDQNCLCYFLQFMEAEDAVPLIKFWLAVENFRISAQTMVEQSQDITDLDDESPKKSNNCDIEDRPLTDDEKSEIIQEQQRQKKRPHKRTKRNSQFQTTVANDALKILEIFLCTNSDSWIDIPAEIHANISLSMCHDERTSLVAPDCFVDAQQFVFARLEQEYLRRFLNSEFYCKYRVEVLTGNDLRLSDILYSECALFYFMEYLEQDQRRDYLDFWMSATNFRRHSTLHRDQASGDAMVLYDKYFSLQATNPLRLSDAVRSQVEERICSTEEGKLVACFDLPIRIVERLFSDFYLERFLASELFYKHITDLASRSQLGTGRHPKVTRAQSLSSQQGRSSGNEPMSYLRRSNSSASISSKQDTHQVAKLGSTVELRIDVRAGVCNGEWGRSNSSNSLSFGRVDALGRFERDFDWEEAVSGAEESTGSRLKKAVKKLVHMTEDKAQEELAWQVAEMIVRDVTDITLSGGGGGNKGCVVNGGIHNGGRNGNGGEMMVVEEET